MFVYDPATWAEWGAWSACDSNSRMRERVCFDNDDTDSYTCVEPADHATVNEQSTDCSGKVTMLLKKNMGLILNLHTI